MSANLLPSSRHEPLIQAWDSLYLESGVMRRLPGTGDSGVIIENLWIAYLQDQLGEGAGQRMIDFLLNPADCLSCDLAEMGTTILSRRLKLGKCAANYVHRNPNTATADGLIARMKWLFAYGFDDIETPIDGLSHAISSYSIEKSYFPHARDCIGMLALHHAHIPQARDFLTEVFTGVYFRMHWDNEKNVEVSNYKILFPHGIESIHWWNAVYSNRQLDVDLIAKVVPYFPSALRLSSSEPKKGLVEAFDACMGTLKSAMLKDLPSQAKTFRLLFKYDEFSGLKWLQFGFEQACEHMANPAELDHNEHYSQVVRQLLDINALDPTDTEADAIALLAHFNPELIEAAMPYTGAAKPHAIDALGWIGLRELDCYLNRIRDEIFNSYRKQSGNGVIDLAALRQVIEACDQEALIKYLSREATGHITRAKDKIGRSSVDSHRDLLVLVSAACNLDRKAIEKKLIRHGQVAIMAYGLYPVVNRKDLLARYTHFKKLHKEATRYGAERQENTQGAVLAGLANLAQVAGFDDANRMEWSLEAELAKDSSKLHEWQPVDDWHIRLQLNGIKSEIAVRRGEKLLKSVPPKVRKHADYKAMREAQEHIRDQARRFRVTLEAMMCAGERIKADEFDTLQQLPAVAAMLGQLILMDEQGSLGFFDPQTGCLNSPQGESVPVSGNLQIAHTWHLFETGVLSQWQRLVVTRGIVQPFKQAFREVYVVTPAEVSARIQSRRFYGQLVKPSIASRLMQARRWSMPCSDDEISAKTFPEKQVNAWIRFEQVGHYFAETSYVTITHVEFKSLDGVNDLDKIDPLVFSETMRDVDLIAGVAQADDAPGVDGTFRLSAELAQHRRDILVALIESMGMTNVSFEDNFVFVKGSLAEYRIHLASGVIHVMPGNYLCIVPERKEDTQVYLPFADTDTRMQEILSKVLLLSNDDSIEDRGILDQIRCG